MEKKRLIFIYLIIGALVFSGLLFYIWQRIEILELGYALQELNKQKDELRTENSQLQLEVSRLSSFDRIEDIALNELGMVKPDRGNVIILEGIEIN